MAQAQAGNFRITRTVLAADLLTAIKPPQTAKTVSIGNATSSDLQVHTNDNEAEYLVISAGYERLIPVDRYIFSPDRVAFWLKASQAGTVVLVWY